MRLSAPLSVAFAALACACSPEPPATFADLQARIFRPSCTASACHTAEKHAGGLSLAPDDAYAALVGAAAENAAAKAEGLPRVTPGTPEQSFLWRKLADDVDPKYGHRMPDANLPLEDDRRTLVESWIRAGALR